MNKEEICEAVASMSVMEVVDLVKLMEEKFGVSAQAVAAAAPVAAQDAGAAEGAAEQSEFTLMLTSAGEKKVNAIKAIRELTSLGLKEAKELVDSAPSEVKSGLSKEDADNMLKVLKEAGCTAELK